MFKGKNMIPKTDIWSLQDILGIKSRVSWDGFDVLSNQFLATQSLDYDETAKQN